MGLLPSLRIPKLGRVNPINSEMEDSSRIISDAESIRAGYLNNLPGYLPDDRLRGLHQCHFLRDPHQVDQRTENFAIRVQRPAAQEQEAPDRAKDDFSDRVKHSKLQFQ
jgi:hypothetical protein